MKEVSDETIVQMTAEAKQHLENFKTRFQEVASRSMSDLVADYLPFIETDAWTNYRQYLQNMVEHNYVDRGLLARQSDEQWARNIRQRIYEDNKEEFQTGLVADLEAQITELKRQLSERRW